MLNIPRGEGGGQVPIRYKIIVKVRFAKYCVEIPILLAEINDNCILDVDFLKLRNL